MDMADEAGPAPDESVPTEGTSETAANSAARSALDQLGYVLSLPERVLRSGTGLVGGMARESAALLVPQSFQTSRTYTAMVQQMLDFLVHDVGGVAAGDQPSSTAASTITSRGRRSAILSTWLRWPRFTFLRW